jgi:hypothetical protein
VPRTPQEQKPLDRRHKPRRGRTRRQARIGRGLRQTSGHGRVSCWAKVVLRRNRRGSQRRAARAATEAGRFARASFASGEAFLLRLCRIEQVEAGDIGPSVFPFAATARRINPRATSAKPACAGYLPVDYALVREGGLRLRSPRIYPLGGLRHKCFLLTTYTHHPFP